MSTALSSSSSSRKTFGWIYRLAAPPEPPLRATLAEREAYRRGRLGSIVMVVMLVLCIFSLPAGFVGTNPLLIPILIVLFLLTVVAILLNRRGMVNIAGGIMVMAFEGGILGNVSSTPGGLTTTALGLFSLLVMPEVLSVALLPAWNVFVVAAFNCLATVLLVTFLPRASGQSAAISAAYFYAILLPFCIQVIVAFVTYLFVQGTTQAIARADRAEEIAKLEQDLSIRDREAADRSEQLQRSTLLIEQALEAYANGNRQARVPLTPDNVLWSIAGKVNNLMLRSQRSAEAEAQLSLLMRVMHRDIEALRRAKMTEQPIVLSRTGTLLDAYYLELNGQVIQPPLSQSNQTSRYPHLGKEQR